MATTYTWDIAQIDRETADGYVYTAHYTIGAADGNVVTPAVEEVNLMAVKEQQMMWTAIKALQEAQTRIETLEAEMAALKAG